MTNDQLINKFPFFNQTMAKAFNYQTELKNFNEEGKKPFNPRVYITVNYKGYPRFKKVLLPQPSKLHDFHSIMMNRKSSREFSGAQITRKQLSTLLYYTAGLRNKRGEDVGNRFYPSAGARYPIEVYPIIWNCEGIKPGIYHYHVRDHTLEFMWTYDDLLDTVFKNIKQQNFRDGGCLFVITAVSNRTEFKYGPRGYRHILMEVGHVCQNTYLAAAGLDLGCCSIGGFLDQGFNALLDVDGYIEKTMLVVSLGKLNVKGGDNYES